MPPFANIRCVLFDAVGTIIYPQPSVREAYCSIGRRFGEEVAEEECRQRFEKAFADEECRDAAEMDFRTSEKREQNRWRAIVHGVFPSARDTDGLFAALWDHFAKAAHWRVFDDVAAAWRELAGAGLQLAVASNFDLRLHVLCKRLPPLDTARSVLVSSLLGRRKPHLEFFSKSAAILKLPPENILVVGDSLDNDIRPALAAGFSAVLSRRNDDVTRVHADDVQLVTSLTELPGLLRS